MCTLIFWWGLGDMLFIVSNIESVQACKSIAGQIEATNRTQRARRSYIKADFNFLCVDSKGTRE